MKSLNYDCCENSSSSLMFYSRSQSPDEDSAWHALEIAAGDGIKTAADLLKPLLAAHLSSDLLLAKARDFGPRLLAHLPPEERNERISILV